LEDSSVAWAYGIFVGYPMRKAATEAMILANFSNADVAQEMGTTEESILAYGMLFFDIQGNRYSTAWLQKHAVRLSDRNAWPDDDYSDFWRAEGRRGSRVLQALWQPELVRLVGQYGLAGYLEPESRLAPEL
jgi:hypothetical protein